MPNGISLTFNKHYEFWFLVTRSWGCMVLPLSWSCWIDAKWKHLFTILYLWEVWHLLTATFAFLPCLYHSQRLVNPCNSIDAYANFFFDNTKSILEKKEVRWCCWEFHINDFGFLLVINNFHYIYLFGIKHAIWGVSLH